MSNLPPNVHLNDVRITNSSSEWSESYMEQQLINITEHSKCRIESLEEEMDFDLPTKDPYTELEVQMKNLHTEERTLQKENHNILKHYEQSLRPEIKNFIEKENILIQYYEQLSDKINQLEEEEAALTADQKLETEAYQKALKMYNTHFDMNIDIESSGDLIVALITFNSYKDMKPIKVVVDKNNREIIDTNFPMSLNTNSNGPIFGPEFLFCLRESFEQNLT